MNIKTNRRQFLGAISVATATAVGISPVLAGTEKTEQGSTHAFSAPPYLQALSPNGVSIICLTTKNAYTWVEYGENGPTNKAHAEHDGFVDAYTTLSKIQLTGLKPGSTYRYRLVSKEIVSFEPYKLVYGDEIKTDTFTFTTPIEASDNVSCLVLNDIHDRPNSFQELMALNGDLPYDFVVLNGDMFNYQTDEQQLIDHLIAPCTKIFASQAPFIMNRGNHETRGKYARDFKQYFVYPQNRYYHAFRQGPVFWIVLDTGEDKEDDAPVYAGIVDYDAYREEQARWLEDVMRTPEYRKAPFKVVLMHIPPFHSGDWHGTMHCRKLFSPLFEKHKVDMVVSGHTHRYGFHKPQADHSYPIMIGGGPKDGTRTIIRLWADNKQLQISMKRDDGTVVGEFSEG